MMGWRCARFTFAAALGFAAGCGAAPEPEGRARVVLVVVEGLDGELLERALGEHRARFPALAGLARAGTRFDAVVPAAVGLNAAVIGAVTGELARERGFVTLHADGQQRVLPPPSGALQREPDLLRRVASVAVPRLDSELGRLDRLFDAYLDVGFAAAPQSARATLERLADHAADAGFLLAVCAADVPGEGVELGAFLRAELPAAERASEAVAPALALAGDEPRRALALLREALGRRRGSEAWGGFERARRLMQLAAFDRALGELLAALAPGPLEVAVVGHRARGSRLDSVPAIVVGVDGVRAGGRVRARVSALDLAASWSGAAGGGRLRATADGGRPIGMPLRGRLWQRLEERGPCLQQSACGATVEPGAWNGVRGDGLTAGWMGVAVAGCEPKVRVVMRARGGASASGPSVAGVRPHRQVLRMGPSSGGAAATTLAAGPATIVVELWRAGHAVEPDEVSVGGQALVEAEGLRLVPLEGAPPGAGAREVGRALEIPLRAGGLFGPPGSVRAEAAEGPGSTWTFGPKSSRPSIDAAGPDAILRADGSSAAGCRIRILRELIVEPHGEPLTAAQQVFVDSLPPWE